MIPDTTLAEQQPTGAPTPGRGAGHHGRRIHREHRGCELYAAGRHRREISRPVGNSRNMKVSAAASITETQFTNHAAARGSRQRPRSREQPAP